MVNQSMNHNNNVITNEQLDSPKTLIILYGNSRGTEVAWESMYQRVMKPLKADLALVLPFGEEKNSLYQRAKYTQLFNEYDDWGDCIDMIAKKENLDPVIQQNWRDILLKNEYSGLCGGVKKGNTMLHGSGLIGFCHRYFIKEFIKEQQLHLNYERFIIARTDTYYAADHPDLDNRWNWIPEGEDYMGICDRHLIVNSESVLKALDVLVWCLKQKCTFLGNPEMVEKLYWTSIKLKIQRFPRTIFLVKSKSDQTRWSECATYIEHLGVYCKYDSELNMTLSNLNLKK